MSDGKITIDVRLVYAVEGRMDDTREVAKAVESRVVRCIGSMPALTSVMIDGSDDWTAGCVSCERKARAVNGRKR